MEATIDRPGVDWEQRRFWAIAEIVAVLLIGAGAVVADSSLGGQDPARHAIAVIITETLIIALIWWSQRRRGLTLADLGLTFSLPDLRAAKSTIGWSLVVAIGSAALWVALAATMSLIAGEPRSGDVSMYDYLRGDPWAVLGTIAAVWFTSSFAEEVIYRGFMISRLEEVFAGARRATPIAVVVGGVIFGSIHYLWGPAGMMLTAAVGIAWGTAYVKLGRRLWVVILAHAYMDTALFAQIYFASATGS